MGKSNGAVDFPWGYVIGLIVVLWLLGAIARAMN